MSDPKDAGVAVVIGAGIAGMQAALDLADRGTMVYLVERTPSIGGRMAQLDKTFPTNDCAMCILAPKMADVQRHPNIRILTLAEVTKVAGKAGAFRLTVSQRPRYVNEEKCTGCGECVAACPVEYRIRPPPAHPEPPAVRDRAEIDAIIARNAHHRSSIVPVLLEVNERYRHLPRDVLRYLSHVMAVPLAELLRLATFYKALSLEPKGRYHIKACMGTACHVRNAGLVVDGVQRYLEAMPPVERPEDRLFTLETVNCLGSCAIGPVMMVNDEVHGNLTQEDVPRILDTLREGAS